MRPWAKGVLCVWMIGVVGSACEPTGQDGTDGNTSWLGACGATSDCISGLSCICGACTMPCAATADCADLGPNGTCLAAASVNTQCTLDAPTNGVCSATCTVDDDCPGGTRCVNELCWLGSAVGAPGAGGAPAAGGQASAGGQVSAGGAPAAGGQGAGGSTSGGASGADGGAGAQGTGASGGADSGADGGAAGSGAAAGGSTGTGGAAIDASSGSSGGTAADGGAPEASSGTRDGGPAADGGADAAASCVSERCGAGTVLCDRFCIDPTSDERRCGATSGCGVTGGSAGSVCAADSRCVGGECVADCENPPRPPALYPTGNFPYAVRIGDLNHDGRPDVVASNASDDSVSVLLGVGDGTLLPKVDFPTGASPLSLAIGDVDGDGDPDLVTVDYDLQGVGVLLGNGDGTFQNTIGTGSLDPYTPSFVTLGDVDGDCRQDLVLVAASPPNTYPHVVVGLGLGDGTFAALADTGVEAHMVALTDLNGDGALDIAAAGWPDVNVALGSGDGAFQSATAHPVGTQLRWVSVGDLDADGVPDLVAGNRDSHDLSVLRGNGDGSFLPAVSYVVEADASGIWPQSPSTLGIGDLNGDGALDVAVGSDVSGQVATMLNDGSGALHAGPRYPLGGVRYLAVGDLDADGRADVASPITATINAVGVSLGGGTADFAPATTFPAATYAEGITAADLDGKNGPDLAIADYNGLRVGVLLSNGDGTFQPMANVAAGVQHSHVIAGDLDGGGVLDLVTTHGPGMGISVLLGSGGGAFGTSTELLAGVTTHDAAIASLNGDAAADVVVTGGTTGNSSDVFILLGKGDGTFQAPQSIALGGSGAQGLSIADVNEDGKQDLLIAVVRDAPGVPPGFLAVLLGNGDGTFQPEITLLAGDEPSKCKVADMNADGHADVVVSSYVYGAMSVLLGTGASDGGPLFQPAVGTYGGAQNGDFSLVEVDGDGRLDAVVSSRLMNDVGVVFGDGTGLLTPKVSYPVGSNPTVVTAADFNGDGLVDIASANVLNHDVSILLGVAVCKEP